MTAQTKLVADCGVETEHDPHWHKNRPDSELGVNCNGQLRHTMPADWQPRDARTVTLHPKTLREVAGLLDQVPPQATASAEFTAGWFAAASALRAIADAADQAPIVPPDTP